MSRVALHCGDARDVLATLPDASVDAVVTDPPYALTSGKNSTKGFMSAQWDNGLVAHDPAFWAEVLRVAKPGAHLVAFGGTRTAHRLACAIEDAGWEIRDSLYLLWCHGQGFPKSLDVSKALDKMAGAEREVVGTWKPTGTAQPRRGGGGHACAQTTSALPEYERDATVLPLTAPASPEAQQWDGWGTALKPAAEPIVLARKPLAEPTVAANVLAHGTGALNIDACRVATGESLNGGAYTGSLRRREGYCATDTLPGAAPLSRARNGIGEYEQPAGRWPPNALFSHHPDCQRAGVRRVLGAGWRDTDGAGGQKIAPGAVMGNRQSVLPRPANGHHTDADGYETVDAWTCHPACPIRLLDEQAGPRTSGANTASHNKPTPGWRFKGTATGHWPASTGSASRFFPTFPGPDPADAVPYLYCPKASRAERQAGCEDLPYERAGVLADDSYVRPADGKAGDTTRTIRGNTHPTVKPLSLCRWLVKLVTVPGGVVLDPFCGSGSTGVACVKEGFGFIGIEMSEDYAAIARARIAYEQEQHAGPLFAGVSTASAR